MVCLLENLQNFSSLTQRYSLKFILKKYAKDERLYRPPGGESSFDIFIRAKKFLKELISENLNLEKCSILSQSEIKANEYSFLKEISSHDADIVDDETKIQHNAIVEDIKKNIPIDLIETDILTKNEISEKTLISDEEKQEKEVLIVYKNYCTDDLKIYDKQEIITFMKGLDLSSAYEKPFPSFDNDDKIKRILVVSHSGFISEIINIIKSEENSNPTVKHHTSNTGLYVIRISCRICGMYSKCKFNPECKDAEKKLEFDFVVSNDVSHLNVGKELEKYKF